jgi:hypothetical protein
LRKRHFCILIIVVFWIICTGFFYRQMLNFDITPGVASLNPPATWPTEFHKPTLIVFLHPKCTCSAASLTQIAKLQSRLPDRFQTILVLWQPSNGNSEWANLPQPDFGQLADYKLVLDKEGRMARKFDAHTSGQSFLYDADGQIRFSGGLTSTRGDSESGPAFSTLAQLIAKQDSSKTAPVFGCSL